MILFTKLLLAHLLGDFVLQPTRWLIHKRAHKARSRYLYIHVVIHFLLVMLLLWDIGSWKIATVIAVSHYFIDLAKLYASPLFKNESIPFFLDQLLHLLVLYVCAFQLDVIPHTMALINQIDWPLLTAVIFVTWPSAIIMGQLLQNMARQIELDHKSLPNAGKYIGIIERIFVLVFILLDKWEAIGLLIAAKSVFRFNDLKESNSRKLTEYILIGTLLSFGLAMITGILYNYF